MNVSFCNNSMEYWRKTKPLPGMNELRASQFWKFEIESAINEARCNHTIGSIYWIKSRVICWTIFLLFLPFDLSILQAYSLNIRLPFKLNLFFCGFFFSFCMRKQKCKNVINQFFVVNYVDYYDNDGLALDSVFVGFVHENNAFNFICIHYYCAYTHIFFHLLCRQTAIGTAILPIKLKVAKRDWQPWFRMFVIHSFSVINCDGMQLANGARYFLFVPFNKFNRILISIAIAKTTVRTTYQTLSENEINLRLVWIDDIIEMQ